MMHSTLRGAVFFLLILSATACDDSVLLDEHVRVKDEQWASSDVVRLETDIADTIHPYNLYINLRHAGSYRYSNLFLFLDTYMPDGGHARDTVELTLADERGQWLGEGMGDVRDNRILFKRGFVFPGSGHYRFELTQAMRVDPLPGIKDAGMCIELSGK
ncbi:MAG: gliding motility lipoprotein GldH [Bacteroidota bacterium]|jgi:gliding motility-associated lipoprotein GldH